MNRFLARAILDEYVQFYHVSSERRDHALVREQRHIKGWTFHADPILVRLPPSPRNRGVGTPLLFFKLLNLEKHHRAALPFVRATLPPVAQLLNQILLH